MGKCMQQITRTLDASNIDEITNDFSASLALIGNSLQGKTGVPLFMALKREKLNEGPYPDVSLFEAANRIMSDLVILKGIAGLLKNNQFPFDSYTVEFGNENRNKFDILAEIRSETLVGEAFNVAPSFFQSKKYSVQKKMKQHGEHATYRILMYNEDAVKQNYSPIIEEGFYHVRVSIESGKVEVIPFSNWR